MTPSISRSTGPGHVGYIHRGPACIIWPEAAPRHLPPYHGQYSTSTAAATAPRCRWSHHKKVCRTCERVLVHSDPCEHLETCFGLRSHIPQCKCVECTETGGKHARLSRFSSQSVRVDAKRRYLPIRMALSYTASTRSIHAHAFILELVRVLVLVQTILCRLAAVICDAPQSGHVL